MTYTRPYYDNDKTKFSHELCQIPDEVAHGCPTLCRFGKPCPDVVGSVCSLAGPELGFCLVSERNSDSFALKLFVRRILRRTSQRATHYLDSFLLEDFPVLTVEIYPAAKESLRLTAKPILIFLYMNSQVRRFVICIPAVMVYKGVAADDTDANLCSELNFCLGLAAYNRTDVWLMYADNAVFARVLTLAQHLLLLVIHVDDGLYGPLLCTVESAVCLVIHSERLRSVSMSR